MLALIAEPLLGIVDTALVGHLSVAALAALAIVASVISGVTWLFGFFVHGTTASVAQFLGEGDPAKGERFLRQILALALLAGGVLIVLGLVFEDAMFAAMGAEESVAKLGSGYYRVRLLGFPVVFSYLASMGFLRGHGDMKTPMVVSIVINIVNIVLNVVLIYGIPGLFDGFGLVGAAWGTVLAQTTAWVWYSIALRRRFNLNPYRWSMFRIDPQMARSVFAVNSHIFLRTAFILAAMTFATAVAARMGRYTLGAHQVGVQMWVFCAFAVDAFAVAGQTICGRLKGAGQFELLHLYGKLLQGWGLVLGALFSLFFLIGGETVASLFAKDQQLIDAIMSLFPFIVAFQPINGLSMVLDGFFIGVLDTRFLALQQFLSAALVYMPLTWLAYHNDWGLVGLWWALTFFMVARFVLVEWRFWSRTYVRRAA